MQTRNAESVFPDPVGAAINVCSQAAIAGQPRDCGSVAASNRDANQVWINGWKSETGMGEGAS